MCSAILGQLKALILHREHRGGGYAEVFERLD